MSWNTRQYRLRNMVGANNNLCFQVCVCVTTIIRPKSDEEFNAIAQAHGINMGDKDYLKLPKKNYIEDMFSPGYFYNRRGFKEVQTMEAEAIYTTTLLSEYRLNEDHSDDLEKIVAQYAPIVEQAHADLRFEGKNYADGSNLSIEFRFFVQPYSLELCHPKDIDRLKPISVLREQPIYPI